MSKADADSASSTAFPSFSKTIKMKTLKSLKFNEEGSSTSQMSGEKKRVNFQLHKAEVLL